MARNVKRSAGKNVGKPVEGLDASDIDNYLKKSTSYIGTVELIFHKLKIKSQRFSLVVNCGHHFFVIYVTPSFIEIFDSLGFLSTKKCLSKNFLRFLGHQIVGKDLRASQKIQSKTSLLCGGFCVYYILLRDKGYTFDQIMNTFSKSLRKNDLIIETFLNKLNN